MYIYLFIYFYIAKTQPARSFWEPFQGNYANAIVNLEVRGVFDSKGIVSLLKALETNTKVQRLTISGLSEDAKIGTFIKQIVCIICLFCFALF